MLRFIIPILFFLLATSCSEISFREPQPSGIKSLSEVPVRLHGTYQMEKNESPAGEMVVFAKGYRIIKDDPDSEPEEYLLSDSLVLKYYKGYYFINFRDESVWVLRVVERKKDGNLTMLELPPISESEERRKQQLDELRKIAPVITTEIDGSVKYIMEPTPKQLLKLIQKGYFREQTQLLKK